MFKATNPDAILLEICFNNINNGSFNNQMQFVSDNLDLLKTYLINIDNVGIWIPHKGGTNLASIPDILKMNHIFAEKLVIEKGYELLGSVSKLFKDLVSVYYPDVSLSDYMLSIGDVHLNDTGHSVYGAFWESL